MKRRTIDKISITLLNQKEFELLTQLKNLLKEQLRILLHLVKSRNIPFTIMILKTTNECINEIRKNIREYDLVFQIPNKENHYLIILQNTNITNAIEIGSRLSSLIKREFIIKKEIIYNQIALISIQEPIEIEEVLYQIVTSLKQTTIDKSEKQLWEKIIKL